MAIIRPTLGPITQSFGNLTTAKWKDKTVIKQKVPTNNTSSSPAQVAQRTKFAFLATLGGVLGPAVRVGFRTLATDKTEQNVFQSKNAPGVSLDAQGHIVFDFTKMVLSAGNVASAEITAATLGGAAGDVTVSWLDNSDGASALPTDKAYTILLNTKTNKVDVSAGASMRSDGEDIVTIPGLTVGNKTDYRVYLFFKRANGQATSPTTTHGIS